jgi:hypothetical protein
LDGVIAIIGPSIDSVFTTSGEKVPAKGARYLGVGVLCHPGRQGKIILVLAVIDNPLEQHSASHWSDKKDKGR